MAVVPEAAGRLKGSIDPGKHHAAVRNDSAQMVAPNKASSSTIVAAAPCTEEAAGLEEHRTSLAVDDCLTLGVGRACSCSRRGAAGRKAAADHTVGAVVAAVLPWVEVSGAGGYHREPLEEDIAVEVVARMVAAAVAVVASGHLAHSLKSDTD